jgi:hypothetical protein
MRLRRNHVWQTASLYLALIGASLVLQPGAHAATTIRPLAYSTHVARVVKSMPAASKTLVRKPLTTVRRPVAVVRKPVASAPRISGNANHILISMRAGRRLTAAQLNQLSKQAGQRLRVESNQGHGQYLLRLPRVLPYSSVQTMSARLKRNTNLLDAVPTQIASTKYMVVKAGHPVTINGTTLTPNAASATRFHWTQIRGRMVGLNSITRPATSFLAPHRIIRRNAAATCDPSIDPTCTSTSADPSLTCDPSIDPTCGTVSSPSAVCDPTVDPTCSGTPSSSDPSLVCDPTVDPTCGGASTTCDPTVDPTCGSSSPSASCDPTVDPTCGGSSPSASCDPTVDPTCSNATPGTVPGASAPIGSCGSMISNSVRRMSVNSTLRKNSLFGGSSGGLGNLGGLLGGLNLGNMFGGMQPADTSSGSSGIDPTTGLPTGPGGGSSGIDPTTGLPIGSGGGSSGIDPTTGLPLGSGGGSSGTDPTTGLPTGSSGSMPSTSSGSNPFGNMFGGGMFGQIMQDINQLFVDINSFMCSLQSGMSNMGGSNTGGSGSGLTGQSVRSRKVVRDNANVLGFRLMTADKAGHNVLHRVYIHVVPNVITRKSASARKPVAAVRKPVAAVRRPATTVRKPVAVRRPLSTSRIPLVR